MTTYRTTFPPPDSKFYGGVNTAKKYVPVSPAAVKKGA